MKTQVGPLQSSFGARGGRSYWIELSHPGLSTLRVIRGPARHVVEQRAALQAAEWNRKWDALQRCWNKQESARVQSLLAQTELDRLDTLLTMGLSEKLVTIDQLRSTSPFAEPEPVLSLPKEPLLKPRPSAPLKRMPVARTPWFFEAYVPCLRRRGRILEESRLAEHEKQYSETLEAWKRQKASIEQENLQAQSLYEASVASARQSFEKQRADWRTRRNKYLKEQIELNDHCNEMQEGYVNLNPERTMEYFTVALTSSEYPENFPREFRIEFYPETQMLLIDYSMPSPESIPTLKEVKYVKSRDELKELHLTDKQHANIYDHVLYQVTLRTINELFTVDLLQKIDSIALNGWVRSLDRSTGMEVNPCVLSLHVTREEFTQVNLANVDPRLCFKRLKGIGSSQLRSLAGITPIVQASYEDSRFRPSYDVAHELNAGYNLATMDWEDFEHLIRELFEKEFKTAGAEVNVTQASRDGGVDAIVFNPDPIHGGKTVIQAKRYTNPVGVGAVRDLYGTVINEGANKGILVTTSDFGPDSYSFIKDKPLVLLNGGNLLKMLEKHGHKARIDLT